MRGNKPSTVQSPLWSAPSLTWFDEVRFMELYILSLDMFLNHCDWLGTVHHWTYISAEVI